jgi:hypothetical protein
LFFLNKKGTFYGVFLYKKGKKLFKI